MLSILSGFTHASINPRIHISGKITVCGHSTQIDGDPWVERGYICLDTYACGGGWLTALEMNAMTYTQSNEQGPLRHSAINQRLLSSNCS